ncbi:MAG TPA: T9SS type A sorting domain-containing protein [Bacteroidia bacterium]|nr:T9SS type A sorting domain-containing protein [Bacteroidia bacterium]
MKTKYTLTKIILPFVLLAVLSFVNNNASAQCSVSAGNDTTVYFGYAPLGCVTLTATPTGTPPFSYLWSNGDTTQSITVCDTVTTSYSVSITDSTSCTATDTVLVTVVDVRCGNNNNKVLVCHVPPGNPANAHTICISPNAVPAHLAHGCYLGTCIPPPVVCSVNLGNDITLCSSQGPLVLDPGSGYVSYLWSDSSASQTLVVSQSGMYWVQVTDSSNCLASDTINVTVFPSPSANAGNDTTIVPPGCASLFGSVTGGTPPYSFLWSNGDTTQAILACDTLTTTYTFTVIDSNGCSATDSVTVIINVPCSVNLGNDTTICSSEAPFIIDAGAGYVSYQWSDSSTTQSIAVSVSGTYWVQVTDSANCIASDSINITVNPSPVASAGNDTTVTDPDCASLFGSATGGTPPYTYLWSTGDTIPDIIVCNTPGTYTYILIVTDSNGCTATDTVEVTVLPMAFYIDPNPNSDNAHIYFIAPQDGPATLEMFDMVGNRIALLFRENVKANMPYAIPFSAGDLRPGIYLVRFSSGDQYAAIRKMIIIK